MRKSIALATLVTAFVIANVDPRGQAGAVLNEMPGDSMTPDPCDDRAQPNGSTEPARLVQASETSIPASRKALYPKLREHADALAATVDRIAPVHREAAEKLAQWIAANHRPGQPLEVIVVCTGNSRRSILGSSMGNVAAAYYGMPEVRFHSGGTDPSAFNERTVSTLKSIGFEIEPTGDEAPGGEAKTANPVYRVSWGEGFETREFSKRYSDEANPRSGFAALMVCSEADQGCPVVKGAAIRLSMPFADPKAYDGGAFESAKYAERRDDIGRVMLFALARAHAEIRSNTKKNR